MSSDIHHDELNINTHIFPFSSHSKGSDDLSRRQCFTDMNSTPPSIKVLQLGEARGPHGHLLDMHLLITTRKHAASLPPTPGSRRRLVQASTYPRCLLWTLAQ